MIFHEAFKARNTGLIQITIWLRDTKKERDYLKTVNNQIMLNPKRTCMYVREGSGNIALFANNICDKR